MREDLHSKYHVAEVVAGQRADQRQVNEYSSSPRSLGKGHFSKWKLTIGFRPSVVLFVRRATVVCKFLNHRPSSLFLCVPTQAVLEAKWKSTVLVTCAALRMGRAAEQAPSVGSKYT